MTAIRVARRRRFTSIDRRALNDAQLSFRARGVLAWLLDKPDDWRTTADTIAAAGKEGRDAVRAALHELERIGYLTRRQWRTTDGKWASEWTVFEQPNATEPDVEPQRISSPGTESGNQRRLTSAGQPHRETRPLTEDSGLKTELPNDIIRRDKEAARSAAPPPWIKLGISHSEYLEQTVTAEAAS